MFMIMDKINLHARKLYKGFSTDIKLSELKLESAIDYSSSEKRYSRKGGENIRVATCYSNKSFLVFCDPDTHISYMSTI